MEDIVKGMMGFIQYWERLRKVNVGGSFFHQYGSWIDHWIQVHLALADLHHDSPFILRRGFGHKVMWLSMLRRLGFGGMGRFIRSLTRMTIMWGLPMTILYHLFKLRCIVSKVICSLFTFEVGRYAKVVRAATLHSKFVLDVAVDNVKDIFFIDAMTTFKDKKSFMGKKI